MTRQSSTACRAIIAFLLHLAAISTWIVKTPLMNWTVGFLTGVVVEDATDELDGGVLER